MTEPDRDGLSYAEATRELEVILAELEADDVDLDVLTVQVRRAAELIRMCRSRLGEARIEIESIVGELDGGPPDGSDEADEADEADE